MLACLGFPSLGFHLRTGWHKDTVFKVSTTKKAKTKKNNNKKAKTHIIKIQAGAQAWSLKKTKLMHIFSFSKYNQKDKTQNSTGLKNFVT